MCISQDPSEKSSNNRITREMVVAEMTDTQRLIAGAGNILFFTSAHLDLYNSICGPQKIIELTINLIWIC